MRMEYWYIIKTRTNHKCSTSNYKGLVLVELSFVLPILLILILGSVELTNSLRIHTNLHTLARELSAAAFRECTIQAYGELTTEMAAETTTCLQGVLTGTENLRSTLLPDSQIVLSVFKWDENEDENQEPVRLAFVESEEAPASPRLDKTDFYESSDQELNLTLQQQEVLSYVEFYYPYKPFVPAIAKMFGYEGNEFYVLSVF